jgi:two-component system sensor histidine kinase KdpD
MKRSIGYLSAFAAVAVLTVGLIPAREHVNSTTVALAFVLSVLLTAILFGRRPALLSSLLAAFSLNFFFLPPYNTLTVAEPENWLALAVFLIVALTVGQLSAIAKRRADTAEKLYADLQTAFEQASEAEAIRRSEKIKSALLDAVTHDIRTPLTSIKAATTMLIKEQQAVHTTLEPGAHADLLAVIDEETDRLNTFVESMVELARLESPGLRPDGMMNIDELIANTIRRAAKNTSGRKIDIDVEPGLPTVRGDDKALGEALYNLIDNAAKYSPDGSAIHISATRSDALVRLMVKDEGHGVRGSEREKIFDKFYRGNKRVKGSGLGLAIVKGIVEAHGGRVFVENGQKGGAKFVIELVQQ